MADKDTTNNGWGGARPGAGQPPLKKGQTVQRRTVRMMPETWQFIHRLGGDNFSKGCRRAAELARTIKVGEMSPSDLAEAYDPDLYDAEANEGETMKPRKIGMLPETWQFISDLSGGSYGEGCRQAAGMARKVKVGEFAPSDLADLYDPDFTKEVPTNA